MNKWKLNWQRGELLPTYTATRGEETLTFSPRENAELARLFVYLDDDNSVRAILYQRLARACKAAEVARRKIARGLDSLY